MPKATIAVVEDDPTNRLLIAQILRKHDFEVLTAADGAAGLELVMDRLPDIVVTDIQMPKLSGMGLLAALRESPITSALPVLMLTSLAERSDVRKGMAAGADDYLTKPFTPQELVDAVSTLLRRQEGLRQFQDAQLSQALDQALELQREKISGQYERRLKRELADAVTNHNIPAPRDVSFDLATLVCANLVHSQWQSQLSPAELADGLRLAYSHATDALSLFGAQGVHLIGNRLIAAFAPVNDSPSVNHAARAVKSAFALVKGSTRISLALQQRHPAKTLDSVQVSVAVHVGQVVIANLQTAEAAADVRGVPVGASVQQVYRLQTLAQEVGCPVLISESSLPHVSLEVRLGRRFSLPTSESGTESQCREVLSWT